MACVLVSLTLSVKGWLVFLCGLRWMPRVDVRSCVPYAECQGLVSVLVFIIWGIKGWPVFLFDLL